MKTLKIKDKEFSIPETFYDITLQTFLNIKQLEDNVDKYDYIDYMLMYIAYLLNITIDEAEDLDPESYAGLFTELQNLLQSNPYEVKDKGVYIDGVLYKFNFIQDKIILAHLIDLEAFSKDFKVWDNAHKICASFLRPIKEKITSIDKILLKYNKRINFDKYTASEYRFDNIVEYEDLFLNKLPLPYVITTIFFFAALRKTYNEYTQRIINKSLKKEKKNNNQPI